MSLRSTSAVCALVCCVVWNLALAGEATDASAIMAPLEPLPDTDLGEQHARGSGETINIDEVNIQLNKLTENASLDHNSVYSSTTGNNSISHDAFAGATGFATVIQNTGNNVIIQNATIVNFAVHNK